ncbi:MAG: hypothetical protein WAT74_10740 [Flavobacteriales bacterium]
MQEEYNPHKPDALGFIPGVYNYCDRWCQKCRFIRQCRVGAVDADELRDEDEDEVALEKVEGNVQRFDRMMDDLSKMQEQEREEKGEESDDEDDGIDWDALNEEPTEEEMADYHKRDEEVRAKVKAHPLTNMSETYMDLCHEWLEAKAETLKARGIDQTRRYELQLVPLAPNDLLLKEAVEEIAWFMTMLPVKTNRCIRGKIEDPDFMERIGLDPLMSDENGTAKLTLHIVDRCREAWTAIAELMPEEQAAAVPILELLRRHEALMREEFPDAEKFIRPGFDAPKA